MAFRNAAAASASLPALAAASPSAKRAFAAGVPLLSPVAGLVIQPQPSRHQRDCEHEYGYSCAMHQPCQKKKTTMDTMDTKICIS